MFLAFHGQRLDKSSAVVLMFLSACLGQLVVSSCGGIMGSLRSEVSRRRASSFYQGGSLGFGALGIFVLASSAEKFSVVTLGWIAAALIAVPSLGLSQHRIAQQTLNMNARSNRLFPASGRKSKRPSSAGEPSPTPSS